MSWAERVRALVRGRLLGPRRAGARSGKAEVTDPTETGSTCSAYGGPFCIYPWFTQNQDGSFSYGVDYPTTAKDFGQADQFHQQTLCGGPFGPDSTYCDTVLH